MPWCEEALSLVKSMAEEGHSMNEMAVAIQPFFPERETTRNMVAGKLHVYGWKITPGIRPKTRRSREKIETVQETVIEKPILLTKKIVTPKKPKHPVPITELERDNMCRWPTGFAGDRHVFCGAIENDIMAGVMSYCQKHRKLSVKPKSTTVN